MDYQSGFDAGYRDGKIISSPINTNGHTEAVFCQIRTLYLHCIYQLKPTDWQRGYGLGLDKAAEEAVVSDEREDACTNSQDGV
jgi:hypothetical protein